MTAGILVRLRWFTYGAAVGLVLAAVVRVWLVPRPRPSEVAPAVTPQVSPRPVARPTRPSTVTPARLPADRRLPSSPNR